MIIILEGPDGSGKTTLAKQLADNLGYEYLHFNKPVDEEDHALQLEMYNNIASSQVNYIIDRCWYSEMVYGVVMRDQSHITLQQMQELELLISKNAGGLIIHCTADSNELWKRLKSRGEDYVDSFDKLRSIKDTYEGLFHYEIHHLPVVRYEYS